MTRGRRCARTSHNSLHSSSWEHRERLGERSATRPGARFQKGFSGMNCCRIAQCVDKGIRGLVLGFNTPPPDLAGVKPKRRAHFSVNICDNDPQEGPPRCRTAKSPPLPSARPPSWSTRAPATATSCLRPGRTRRSQDRQEVKMSGRVAETRKQARGPRVEISQCF